MSDILSGISGVGSLIGGLTGAASSISGANDISNAAKATTDWQKQVYGNQQKQLQPWTQAGQSALYSLASLLGIGGVPAPGSTSSAPASTGGSLAPLVAANGTAPQYSGLGLNYNISTKGDQGQGTSYNMQSPVGGLASLMPQQPAAGGGATAAAPATSSAGGPLAAYQQFTETPYYQFPLQQAMLQLQRSNAARGLLNSGATAKDILQQATGYASGNLQSYMQQLSSLAGGGQQGIESTGSTGVGVGSQISGPALTGAGAQASGLAGANQNLFGQNGALTPLLNSAFNSSSYPGSGSSVSGNTIMSVYG